MWWDFENCNVPAGTNVFKVAPAITAAIRANGIKGPVQITAFGDVMQLSRVNQEAFSSTGMNLTHIPRGEPFNPLLSRDSFMYLVLKNVNDEEGKGE